MKIIVSEFRKIPVKTALILLPIAILGLTPRLWLFSIFITIVYWLIGLYSCSINKWHFAIDRYVWTYVLILIFFLCLSILFIPPNNNIWYQKILYFIFVILPFSILISFLFKKPEDIRYVLWGYTITGLIIAALSISFSTRYILGAHRYVWAGNFCAISSVIILQFWIIRKKILAFVLALIDIWGILVIAARQSVVIFIFGFIVICFFNLFGKKKEFTQILILLLVIGNVFYWWEDIIHMPVMSLILNRIESLQTYHFIPLGDRYLIYDYAWKLFLNHPIIGGKEFGYFDSGQGIYSYPHNIILEVLGDFGIIGATILFAPIVVAGFITVRQWFTQSDQSFSHLLILFLCFLIIANLSGDLIGYRGHWIFAILMLRFASLSKRNKETGI